MAACFEVFEFLSDRFSWWLLLYVIVVDPVFAVFSFALTISTVSVGVGLSLVLIGIPFLTLALIAVRFLGVVELSIVRKHTEVVLSLPSASNMSSELGVWKSVRRLVFSAFSWRCVIYFAVIKPVISLFNFVVTLAVFTSSLAFVANIVVVLFFGDTYDDLRDDDWGTVGEIFKWPIVNWEGSIGLVVLGILLGIASFFIASVLARYSNSIARYVLLSTPGQKDSEEEHILNLTQPYTRLQPKYSKRRVLGSAENTF